MSQFAAHIAKSQSKLNNKKKKKKLPQVGNSQKRFREFNAIWVFCNALLLHGNHCIELPAVLLDVKSVRHITMSEYLGIKQLYKLIKPIQYLSFFLVRGFLISRILLMSDGSSMICP